MNTLIREKANVVRLRALLEKETDPLIKESISFRLAEARLWHDVAEHNVLTPEHTERWQSYEEQIKTRRRVKYAVIGIGIIAILAILLFAGSGCNAIDGFRTDIHQWTDNPAHHQEK